MDGERSGHEERQNGTDSERHENSVPNGHLDEHGDDRAQDELGPQVAEQGRAFMRDRFLVGDEAFVRDEMQRYRDTLGVDLFRLRMEWDGLAQEKVLGSIERLGRAAAGVR